MEAYEVLELIGEGSFGRVFRARLKAPAEGGRFVVALKLVPKVGQSPVELDALRRECKIQRRLDHANVVRALNSFETPNELVLVTEFVDGGNLAGLMSRHPAGLSGSPALLKGICVDLVCALHYLHGQRILHRDLKPQNVLLDERGVAKLADFGFARNLGLNTLVLTSIKGTPLYMAPELIEERPYDYKADLWSAGGILYEVAVGQPPFNTTSLFQLIKKIRYEQISWPPRVPEACTSFLQGLLEKDCKRRMTWDQLLGHRFVSGDARVAACRNEPIELTKPLTASQELAKEMQRQDKAKKLAGGSTTLINIAQRFEEQKKRQLQLLAPQQQTFVNVGRRYSDFPHYRQLVRPEPTKGQQRRNSDAAAYRREEGEENNQQRELAINNDEWSTFLDGQIGEVVDNASIMTNANHVAMLLKPMARHSQASDLVLLKLARLLSVPFAIFDDCEDRKRLVSTYARVLVGPHLVSALQMVGEVSAGIVNASELNSGELNTGEVNAGEVNAGEQIALLLSRLCHSSNDEVLAQISEKSKTLLSALFSLGRLSDNTKLAIMDVLIALPADAVVSQEESLLDLARNQLSLFRKVVVLLAKLAQNGRAMNIQAKMLLERLLMTDAHPLDENFTKICRRLCSV